MERKKEGKKEGKKERFIDSLIDRCDKNRCKQKLSNNKTPKGIMRSAVP